MYIYCYFIVHTYFSVCHLQRKPSFLVVYVRRSVMSIKSVGCDECDTWYRYSCEKLDQHHIKEVESLPLEYVCTNCTTRWGYFQYQNSLQRLSLAASKSVSCGQLLHVIRLVFGHPIISFLSWMFRLTQTLVYRKGIDHTVRLCRTKLLIRNYWFLLQQNRKADINISSLLTLTYLHVTTLQLINHILLPSICQYHTQILMTNLKPATDLSK